MNINRVCYLILLKYLETQWLFGSSVKQFVFHRLKHVKPAVCGPLNVIPEEIRVLVNRLGCNHLYYLCDKSDCFGVTD